MKIFVLILLMASSVWARECTMDEIRQIDTRRAGLQYSPFPLMTKVALMSSLLPLVPHLDAGANESTTFWTVNFIGLGGWVYFGLQSMASPDCDDDRTGARFYQPSLAEVVRFHHQERDLFWNTYWWSSAWMAGVILSSRYSDRQAVAAFSLAIPWFFSLSRPWTPFSADSELQLGFAPLWDGKRYVLNPSLQWSF